MQPKTMRRLYHGLLATGLVLGVGLTFPTGTALAKGEPDHLQCYDIKDSHPSVIKVVNLYNEQFGASECKIDLHALQLCAPTTKLVDDGDDPRGGALKTDFLCYKIRCSPVNQAAAEVDDQFGHRKIRIGAARTLCTPTDKRLID